MSWHNSNNPSRPTPRPRLTTSRPSDEAQSRADLAANAAPLPRGAQQRPERLERLEWDGLQHLEHLANRERRIDNATRERLSSLLRESWTTPLGHGVFGHRHQDRPSLPPSRFDAAPQTLPAPSSGADFASRFPNTHRMASLEQLDRTLDEANAHLRALLDMTSANSVSRQLLPTNPSPSYAPSTRAHDFTYDNQRNKRRKVDEDKYATVVPGFRYGHYGQVEAGNLEMELVSCDGGMFSNGSSYAAENILKDDQSVYCTKGNRCNIVLRHRGSTTFTLSELIIKAPGSMNYSNPVREGMVFISMEHDDVLHRTTQYQIQYTPSTARAATGPAARDRVTFTSTDSRTRLNHEAQQYGYYPGSILVGPTSFLYTGEDGIRAPQMPREFSTSQPDFRISTEFSDEDEEAISGSAAPVSILRRPPPNRIGTLPFENDEESDSDLDWDNSDSLFLHESSARRPRHPASTSATNLLDVNLDEFPGLAGGGGGGGSSFNLSSNAGVSHGSAALTETWAAHTGATQDAGRAVGGGSLLAPHARFHIEKKKSKCTMRFDPPVSGRFILLKMWSSNHDPDSNIDIQAVLARGFAGPRYFPALEMR
ncbi:hypothetical protein ISF_06551 [Cordyceps fumosorosea ARSEF 2679]|uniref:Eukaryotic translation initiation factor 6 n=1 Tax=Cordyceps fumosorosea (strain ARSEF 2679) TaxID=1081104 RepID=A0A167RNF3_CORFA|nr:hypothetical protein ISF_06551 [Cordyceps fumosorosea ARSEF 2679]OAA58768.1 hypothetical protein ISF_06551 [Cordyceps fumosorosea ARSEF 2679]